MIRISNYRANTQFASLKQLTEKYSARLQLAARVIPALSGTVTLGTTQINVPAGVYAENIITRCSIDGGVNHISPQFQAVINDQGYLYVTLNQTTNNTYTLSVKAENLTDTTMNLPNMTTEAILRLAIAPF